jgi:hypothetical protein
VRIDADDEVVGRLAVLDRAAALGTFFARCTTPMLTLYSLLVLTTRTA